MIDFFIMANSFAAPIYSDTSTDYVTAETAGDALRQFAKGYTHPCGLYSAVAYKSADDYHRGGKPVARWLSHKAIEDDASADPTGGRVVS